MRAINMRLGATGLALILMAGLAAPAGAQDSSDIDFGDDTSEWANDGECDDLRFVGTGMAVELEDADVARDATDCRTLFEAGTITLAETAPTSTDTPPVAGPTSAEFDFGDDSSTWANDYECDDPRFSGTGMGPELLDENILRDASDCRSAFEEGTIFFAETAPDTAPDSTDQNPVLQSAAARINFGDDSGEFAHDGECDDPDFSGTSMAAKPSTHGRLTDASDCRAAFLAGRISLAGLVSTPDAPPFDYGNDMSRWSHDQECDDPRFSGVGMSKKLFAEDVLADASDCQALESSGEISIKLVYQPDYLLGAPYDSSGVYFGDNSSSYANDNICDDPRFEGPGVASTLLDSDLEKDAEDCQALYEQGKIILR